ncbi:hypothetical protein [Sphingomonas sp. Leaf10]|uniref:hypothetical protein n=1 Tax=Sphingomonas sp. Leaf10 TaxID=1735676 RepID=UPI000AB78D03|nr:hypothetical protein [Sphingomonas sp. Leaf10]
MSAPDQRWLAIGVPMVVGGGVLLAAILLLPGRTEVLHVERRAQPVSIALPPPLPAPPPAAAPQVPALADAIAHDDAEALAALTTQLQLTGQKVTTLQVAYDLKAAGRGPVALAYLAVRPDGTVAETWPLRIDLLAETGQRDAAAKLFDAAQGVPGPAIVAAAYTLDRPDLLVAAAERGTIPRPAAALSLDLARRLERVGQGALIARLDRVGSDWRRGDPWLAIRVAQAAGDQRAALAAAGLLPVDQRDAAREAILTRAGDRAGLRHMLLARAQAPGADPLPIAEQLLAAGARDDAVGVLAAAVGQGGPDGPAARRLLYLLGPRPGARDVAWLRQRTLAGSGAQQLDWIAAYADRDRPGEAAAFLTRHPLADRTPVLLTRLRLAQAAGDDRGGQAVLARLLDGRALSADAVRAAGDFAPRRSDPAQLAALLHARVATGIAAPRDRMDLAWSAWNAGDAPRTVQLLRDYLANDGDDLPALRLMADAQAKIGGDRAARPWLEKALAQTLPDSRAYAELLDRLGRRREAVALVERLRQKTPSDRQLVALHARLLIADGQPGRARMLLSQQ